jgi:hypothetical protein
MDMGGPAVDPGMCPDFLQHLLISSVFSKCLMMPGCLPASHFTAPLAAADPRVLDRVLDATNEQPHCQSCLMTGLSA